MGECASHVVQGIIGEVALVFMSVSHVFMSISSVSDISAAVSV